MNIVRCIMPALPSQAEIGRQIDQLTKVASDPRTLEALQKVSEAPENDRAQLAEQLVTPTALAGKGVPMPENMRISLRVFEEPTNVTLGDYSYDTATGQQTKIEPGVQPKGTTICGSIGFIACISVGKEIQ